MGFWTIDWKRGSLCNLSGMSELMENFDFQKGLICIIVVRALMYMKNNWCLKLLILQVSSYYKMSGKDFGNLQRLSDLWLVLPSLKSKRPSEKIEIQESRGGWNPCYVSNCLPKNQDSFAVTLSLIAPFLLIK